MFILIVEDEDFAAKRINKLLKEILPEVKRVSFTKSVKGTLEFLMSNTPDLILMDIQLSDGVSFKVFEQMEITTPVIFTTAYDQYAIKAFDANSVAYLLKPVRKNELEKAVNKYKQIFNQSQSDMLRLWQQIRDREPAYKQRFVAQRGEKIFYLQIENVAYFYVIQKDTYAVSFEGKTYALDSSLEAIMDQVNPNFFFRINRQYIINIKSIDSMVSRSRGRIKLNLTPSVTDPEETVVSVARSSEFRNWLDR